MRILFLTDNFVPETNAPAYRTYEHCKEWAKAGVEITVISCAPNFPKGKVYEGYKNKLYQSEIIDGIKVIRVWSYMAENKGTFKRTLDFVSFMISSFLVGLFVRTDLIVATSPQFFTALSGRWLAFWKGKKWVMEVRDLWPESIKVVGAMKDNLAIHFFEFIEHRLYKNAWRIVVVTEYMKNTIVTKHKISEDKLAVIRNGVDLEKFQPVARNLSLQRKIGLENKFIIGYIGTHGLAHALDFIVKASVKIKNPDVHLLFVGSGAAKPDLVRLKDELNAKNITFLDPVTKKRVADYISILDYGLVNLKDSKIFEGALPSKMNELIAMGKPVLLGVKGEAKEFLSAHNLGVSFEPENEDSFLEAVDLITGTEIEVSKNLNEVRSLIDRKKLAGEMLDFLYLTSWTKK